MGVFDYNSFADLSRMFDSRRGQIIPPQPKARVTLYATTAIRTGLAQSKFTDLKAFMPTIKPRFLSVAASSKKPVPASAPLSPVIAEESNPSPVIAAEEPKKARSILKLKTKVELPVLTSLSRRSTAQDLAAVFKAEMALVEKKKLAEPAKRLEDAFTRKRRHPLSNKPWSELIAEAEAPKASKTNFDLATAFKAEMKAFMAEQEKMGEVAVPVKFKTAAEHKTVSPQPPPVHRRPSLAA